MSHFFYIKTLFFFAVVFFWDCEKEAKENFSGCGQRKNQNTSADHQNRLKEKRKETQNKIRAVEGVENWVYRFSPQRIVCPHSHKHKQISNKLQHNRNLSEKKNLSFTEGKYQVQENESGITRTMLERGLWVEEGGRGLQ